MSTVSTHVLDAATGRPAAGVSVRLERAPSAGEPGDTVVEANTDIDGRLRLDRANLTAGVYRLVFDTGTYFSATGREAFYPEVSVTFWVRESGQHYHVPLLLSPFAYSTYRGS